MNQLRLLLVTTNFWPEPTGSAPVATDLVKALSFEVNFVQVLTTYPHYPWWKIPKEFNDLEEISETSDGYSIIRASHYIPRSSNLISRALYELSLLINLSRTIRTHNLSNFDLVVTIGSSFSGHFIGRKLSNQKRIPLLIIIHDLIGKGLEQSGIPGGKYIARIIRKFEFKNLENASKIAVISPTMKSALEDMGISPSAITLIPLYGIHRIQELDNQEAKLANGWHKNSFTVVYSGNMGNKQNLETLIEAAKMLDTESEIQFYLVGHGNREIKLKELASGLGNINFLSSVSDEKFPTILAGADLLVICERASQTEMSLPSKLTSYFFSNRPVIASVPTSGATAQYLNGLALIVPAENPKMLAEGIIRLKTNLEERKLLAQKALDFAQSNLSIENGRKRYVNWVLNR